MTGTERQGKKHDHQTDKPKIVHEKADMMKMMIDFLQAFGRIVTAKKPIDLQQADKETTEQFTRAGKSLYHKSRHSKN